MLCQHASDLGAQARGGTYLSNATGLRTFRKSVPEHRVRVLGSRFNWPCRALLIVQLKCLHVSDFEQ